MNENDIASVKKYLGRIICALCAFVLGLMFVTLGPIKTVFVLALAVGGYFLGRVFDDKETLRRIINNYLGRF